MSNSEHRKADSSCTETTKLYDKTDRDHSDRYIQANLWEAIQAELEVNGDGENLIF